MFRTATTAAAAFLVAAAGASATIVEVTFQGVVSESLGSAVPDVGVGSTFTGVFRYDTNGPFADGEPIPGPGAIAASYQSLLSYSLTFRQQSGSDITFNANHFSPEQVVNDQPFPGDPARITDSYSNAARDETLDLSGNVVGWVDWSLGLTDASATVFDSVALPDSLSLADFSSKSFGFSKISDPTFPVPFDTLGGELTGLTSRVIPAPGAAGALLAAGSLAAFRRRRN